MNARRIIAIVVMASGALTSCAPAYVPWLDPDSGPDIDTPAEPVPEPRPGVHDVTCPDGSTVEWSIIGRIRNGYNTGPLVMQWPGGQAAWPTDGDIVPVVCEVAA